MTALVPFTEAAVAGAPDESGVYFLYRQRQLVFIGMAPRGTGVRAALQRHLARHGGPNATAFAVELFEEPVSAYRRHMASYMNENAGQMPEGNRAALVQKSREG